MRWLVVLALVCACEDDRRARARADRDLYQLRGAMAEHHGDMSKVAWLAEATFADRRAAIVWFSVQHGQVVGGEVIAYAFVRDGDRWRQLDQRTWPTLESLRELLGGHFELVRPSGPSIDDLGPALLSSAKRFRAALRARDDADAVRAVESFSRGISDRLLFESDEAFEILEDEIEQVRSVEVRDVGPGDHPSARIAIEICENGRCDTIHEDTTLTRQGRGWAIDEL